MNGEHPNSPAIPSTDERGVFATLTEPFPVGPCQCFDESEGVGCMCAPAERGLRSVIAAKGGLTPAQREWCCQEIESIEGHTRPPADWSDESVAREVLSAWTDYCRDKGML